MKGLDHYSLPRVVQENISEGKLYLVIAACEEESNKALPLHRWVQKNRKVLQDLNMTRDAIFS